VDGILGHNLLLSQAFLVGIPSWMGFRLLQSLFHNLLFFHNGILAIRKPFTRTFSVFMMEFWPSGSLSHKLFLLSRWTSGYQEAFLTNFFLFSRWNSGYQEAFLTNFFFFSRWNSGYQEAFLMNFFFFHDGILAIRKPFSQKFSFFTMEFWLSGSLSHKLFLFSRWNS
jgi:hypothetical protein